MGDDARELVERARAGDGDAWETLYERCYPRLLAYAQRRLPAAHEAREAVAEVMARAMSGIHRFRSDGAGLDAWLYGIMRHVVVDVQRASARRSTEPVREAESADPGPLDHVLGSEEAARLRRAFARLSPSDQELLELRVVGGLTAEEVGRLLGKRSGAVRTAQSRALQRLRQLLRADAVE